MKLSGSEAVARAAIEAGVSVITSYPGEPISLPTDILAKLASKYDMHVEWSVNEKVAYEVALGASIVGLRTLVCVKHVGFNWILDPFIGSMYAGVKGGLVIVVGDDPSATGSTNEEDTRFLTELAEAPLLEPSTPDEIRMMIKFAFDLSEDVMLPVVVRIVTRLTRKVGFVEIGEVREKNTPSFGEKWFVKESLLSQHQEIHRKNLTLEEMSEESCFNTTSYPKDCELGIIGCGSVYQLSEEIVRKNMDRVGLMKIGFVRPPPREKIIDFGKKCRKILVVEEVQPFLESMVRQILNGVNCHIYGKITGYLPWSHELTAESIVKAAEKITGWTLQKPEIKVGEIEATQSLYTQKPCFGMFDPHCPHKSTFLALKNAIDRTTVPVTVLGDVGCMSLELGKDDPIIESMICMGSSPGMASGVKLASKDRRVIAVIGDSSFYHSGLQGVINAIYNKIPIIVLVLDNQITAQSGFQPDPGSGLTATHSNTHSMLIEDIIKALKGRVLVVRSFNSKEVEKAIIEALKCNEPIVIISRGKCPIAEKVEAYSSFRHMHA